MLQPVGSLPPTTYWRRRLAVAVIAVALVVLTGFVLFGGGKDSDKPVASTHSLSKSAASSPRRTSASSKPPSAASTAASGTKCKLTQLSIAAATGKPSYKVSAQPALYLVVINPAKNPCVQDLGDPQVELTVYTGDVRVWGSHDCQVHPGASMQRLMPKKPVRLEVVWSGQTSQPGCGGTRLQVQAGTYRLYAALAGTKSAPVMFTVKS